jgi:isocitrate dehydrogenase
MAPFSGPAAAKALLLNPSGLAVRGRLPSPPACLPAPGARVFRGASLRCYAAAAVAEQHRIKVQNPIVEMDGACLVVTPPPSLPLSISSI